MWGDDGFVCVKVRLLTGGPSVSVSMSSWWVFHPSPTRHQNWSLKTFSTEVSVYSTAMFWALLLIIVGLKVLLVMKLYILDRIVTSKLNVDAILIIRNFFTQNTWICVIIDVSGDEIYLTVRLWLIVSCKWVWVTGVNVVVERLAVAVSHERAVRLSSSLHCCGYWRSTAQLHPNIWEILSKFLCAYYVFMCVLGDRMSFSYLEIW